MSKRDVSSDINLSPVQLINVALLDYMNNMGVVSIKELVLKIHLFVLESTKYGKEKLWSDSWYETSLKKINGTCPSLSSFQCCTEFFARLWNL